MRKLCVNSFGRASESWVQLALFCFVQGVLLKDCEPMAILKHMSLYATALLLVATVVLEGDSFSSLPAVNGNSWFYAGLLMNCSLAMASNYLSIRVTQATGPLTMQVSTHGITTTTNITSSVRLQVLHVLHVISSTFPTDALVLSTVHEVTR
jgi:hypothetical protein